MSIIGRKIYTVSIYDMLDEDMDIWTASFSSRKRAEAFRDKVIAKLNEYEATETVKVTLDSGEINDEEYIDWLDGRYGED